MDKIFMVSRRVIKALIFLSSLFVGPAPVYAEQNFRSLILSARVQSERPPANARLLVRNLENVSTAESVVLYQAAFVAAEPVANEHGRPTEYLLAAKVELPLEICLVDLAGILIYEPSSLVAINHSQPRTQDVCRKENIFNTDAERALLLQRKEILSSYNMQQQVQESNLNRLKADAELIANIGRILEVEDKLERLGAEISDLEKDRETLSDFIALVRTRPAPRAQAFRENQLTSHLGLLASAAKSAESQVARRRSSAQSILQRRLAIVEQTRFEDLDLLQRELIELRQRRMRLEQGEG